MQRIVAINGVEYRLANNAYTPIAYKAEFGKDYFQDLLGMFKNNEALQKILTMSEKEEFKTEDMDIAMLADFDMTFFQRLFYIFAKSANPTIKTFVEFYMEMEVFPCDVVGQTLMEMLSEGMQTKKKSMKAQMQAMSPLQ